jgi:catechol 2,3-dioxygenase-like lactoylglutathione lyase family enzyme
VKLAKQHLDVGLFTSNERAMLHFWQHDVGLAFEETLPLGGGVRQHRHAMNGSVLKLNAARDAITEAPLSGYRELAIARADIDAPRMLVDPDGNKISLVPPGHDGIIGIQVRMAVRDAAAMRRFFGLAMQFEGMSVDTYRCGDSLIRFHEDPSVIQTEPLRARGFRYLTVQVYDVNAEHRGIVQRGGQERRPPVTLGATARVSFVRDPDGNWIEVSQRASLTGTLS